MAAIPVTLVGELTDPQSASAAPRPVIIVGMISLSGLTVGGGPVYPPQVPPGIGAPPHPSHPIYPGEHPEHPIVLPPDWPPIKPPVGAPPHPSHPIYPGEHPEHPIVIPPPGYQPPSGFTPPPPGSTEPVGPPQQPVNPIAVPEYILIQYPGYGWIAVGKPVPSSDSATPTK